MIESKLLSQWGIWFIYQGESYEGNVHLVTSVGSYADLAYVWLHSPIASLSNFFLNEQNRQKAYLVDGSLRKVNSIEFFRKGIEPKWEDPQNQDGGRFIFQVPKSQPNKELIYEQLTFFFLGEHYDRGQKVNGFRFISTKVNNPSSYRIEIWVSFDESDIDSIISFQEILTDMFHQLSFEVKDKIQFRQMKSEGTKDTKEREPKGKEPEGREGREAK